MTKYDIFIARIINKYLTRSPILRGIGQSELSIICSPKGDNEPSQLLIDLSLQAAKNAFTTDLEDLRVQNETLSDSAYYNTFPGEHYRLLQALVKIIAPTSIIEIGTFTGMSAASMLHGMPEGCSITTFDICSWREHDSHLKEGDFTSGKIRQVLADLADSVVFEQNIKILSSSQLIFCDAAKDGSFEFKFLANLTRVKPDRDTILILDDIRQLNMIDVWRSIQSPKLDLTSFGHWSGTGLVDLTEGLRLNT